MEGPLASRGYATPFCFSWQGSGSETARFQATTGGGRLGSKFLQNATAMQQKKRRKICIPDTTSTPTQHTGTPTIPNSRDPDFENVMCILVAACNCLFFTRTSPSSLTPPEVSYRMQMQLSLSEEYRFPGGYFRHTYRLKARGTNTV